MPLTNLLVYWLVSIFLLVTLYVVVLGVVGCFVAVSLLVDL